MTASWAWDWALRNLIAELLMPPGIWLLIILSVTFLLKNNSIWKKIVILCATSLIWVTSTQAFYLKLTQWTNALMHWPVPYDLKNSTDSKAAIVILGGGLTRGALEYPEYGQQDLSKDSLSRLRFGAHFSKSVNLPILLSGGSPYRINGRDMTESQVMAQILVREWNISPRWQEKQSQTTQENATYSKAILKNAQIDHIYLVTQFWHMPRAKAIFEANGFSVTPVPMGFETAEHLTPLDYYPSGSGFSKTRNICHEVLGMLWYRWRYLN